MKWEGCSSSGLSAASLVGNSISENDGPGVSVRSASHADLAGNQIDGNGLDGVTVTQNSYVQLGGEPGILNPPNETTVENFGFGLRCSLNSSAAGRLATLTGVDGTKCIDPSCTNGWRIRLGADVPGKPRLMRKRPGTSRSLAPLWQVGRGFDLRFPLQLVIPSPPPYAVGGQTPRRPSQPAGQTIGA